MLRPSNTTPVATVAPGVTTVVQPFDVVTLAPFAPETVVVPLDVVTLPPLPADVVVADSLLDCSTTLFVLDVPELSDAVATWVVPAQLELLTATLPSLPRRDNGHILIVRVAYLLRLGRRFLTPSARRHIGLIGRRRDLAAYVCFR